MTKKSIAKFIAPVIVMFFAFYLVASAVTVTVTQSDFGGSTGSTVSSSCNISGYTSFKDIVMKFVIGCILARSVYLLIALAVIMFLFGVFRFIVSESDTEKQSGKEFILWGLVGLFVIVSVWGLVYILQSTFHISGNYDITPRQVNVPSL